MCRGDVLRRFRVVIVELHGLDKAFLNPRVLETVLSPSLSRLDEDFRCVHAYPNNSGAVLRTHRMGNYLPDPWN